MAISIDSWFSGLAPHMVSEPTKSFWLQAGQEELDPCSYGYNYNKAVALYAAHNMTLALGADGRSPGQGGSLERLREGDLELEFSNAGINLAQDSLDQTSYGKMLKDLMLNSNPAILVTGGLDSGGLCGNSIIYY